MPTIIEADIDYQVNRLVQRDRRSYRVGQTKDIEIYYIYTENSVQELALKLIAAKLRANSAIEGTMVEGIALLGQDESETITEAILKQLVSGKKTGWGYLKNNQIKRKKKIVVVVKPTPVIESNPQMMVNINKQTNGQMSFL